MNNLYVCKVTATQASKQIDIPKPIATSFFEMPQEVLEGKGNQMINVCHRSNLTKFEQIEIQGATNVRFSTKLSSFLTNNGDVLEANDMLVVEKVGKSFSIGVIKKDTAKYNVLKEFFDDGENHLLLTASINMKNQEGDTYQIIFYGAPGTGKSHEVKLKTGELLESGKEVDLPNVFRTTFHPDTDYASFVGCYKPTMRKTGKKHQVDGKDVDDEEIIYTYTPQSFTDAYVHAYTTKEPTYLVIEEINRGNCAQIFGDLFQLLDRKNGVSEYKIKADKDLAQYLIEKLGANAEGIQDGKLCLPANLHILATMNTSDQSLFPMDSAFKRRWEWEYVPINYDKDIKSGAFKITIGDNSYSWVEFIEKVNEKIFALTQSEDKQMGNFFIKHSIDEKGFKSKVMFYLWYEILRDETENSKYFFYKKTTVEGKEVLSKFTFKDLYGKDATETLQQFMAYLEIPLINENTH